ncbi:N-acetyltransferase [Lactonifactor sp. BIOML-A3]|uniref:N-acetyltransferase n=1 Tax=unclassified Lactonifactor TaxID=2636670 RepID=UPI0012B14057|nr:MULTISPECIES: N-acetyltransferase [unclassified Lactonifactor]MSA01013.1 N-acetyltransferase [Lactonifactor sp. BIOML-A5]MSA07807.1 N-acetyltransferase [Lactonifactor sp. BIOML-A4]MSA12003.1 N-acetyltransferase [Lactonifactor sp. BIOML-A3]MSA16443.1 N-acetyltransferase [Lactonifactor sp. BIOML-A2]MSA37047.1 N-acetyltransferase [Lactonifactor sp. BIOML-A1]
MPQFVQFNLSDLTDMLGEDDVKSILSSFSCPMNKDVEDFIRNKAIEFSKRGFAKTHLVFWVSDDQTEKELVGYYTVAPKVIKVDKKAVSKSVGKRLRAQGINSHDDNEYIVPAPLIGQLGKNYADGNNCLISGNELLALAVEKVKLVQNEIGGRFVYLECEEKEKLLEFYQENGFKIFGKRLLDRDETGIDGEYLIQLFAIL